MSAAPPPDAAGPSCDPSAHDHRRPLERPVLTITGAVGLLLGSVAWLVTGNFASAPLVFAASLATAVTLAFAVDKAVAHAAAQIERSDLRATAACGLCGPLIRRIAAVLAAAENRAEEAEAAATDAATRLALARTRGRQLELLLDRVPDPAVLADGGGAALYRNPAAAALLGGDGGALADLPELAALARSTDERRESARRRTAEFAAPGPNGRPCRFRATAEALTGDAGRPLGVALVARDATDSAAEKQNLAEFVSAVAHELKTPMAAIGAYAEMLEDGDFETAADRREIYGVIGDQCDRLTRLVENMLGLARIESGVVDVRRRDMELNDVLTGCVDPIRQLADTKDIALEVELSDLYLAVNVDPDLLSQAVTNLLSNAVKYTPEGGTVRLRSRLEDDRAVVEVRDSGMGIPADDLPHIFGRFYRVAANESAAKGTGLGLALVHSVTTELHDGSVSVESEVGKGSRFALSLPFGHRDARRTPAAETKSPTAPAPKAEPAAVPA